MQNRNIMNTDNTNKFYPTISQGFGILLLFILISMLTGMIVAVGNLSNNERLITILTSFSYLVAAGGTLLIIIRQKRRFHPDYPVFVNKRTYPVTIIFSILSALAIIILSEPLISMLPVSDLYKDMITRLNQKGISILLMTVVFAPVLEELLIRGIILEGFLRNYSPGKAILFSSLIFGILHFNLIQFVGAFIIGLFIGWVYYKTRNLILPVLIHFANNLLSYILLYISDSNPLDVNLRNIFTSTSVYWVVMGIAGIILISNFIFHKKIMNPKQIKN